MVSLEFNHTEVDMAPKAYIYVRMSTEQQSHGDSLPRQTQRAEAFCRQHGLEIDRELDLRDIGVSAFTGANVESGALGRFLEAIKEHKVPRGSYLLIESHDRLSRMEPEKALPIFLEIRNAGISIAVLADNRVFHPTGGNHFELIEAIIGMARSHDESRMKSDRGRRNWESKRNKMGSEILTRRCPGWVVPKDDDSGFELDLERAKAVKLIFDLVLSEGLGSDAIARDLNRRGIQPFGHSTQGWQKSSVNAILKSRATIGEIEPKRQLAGKRVATGHRQKDYFPPVVSEADFFAVQQKRSGRARGGGRIGENVRNIFTGVARCGYCGGAMHFQDTGAKQGGTYLVCDRARRDMGCSRVRWPYPHFEAAFLTFMPEVDIKSLTNEFIHKDELATLRQEIESTTGRLTEAETRHGRIFELWTREGPTEFLANAYSEAARLVEDTRSALRELERRQNELKSENRAFTLGGQNIALLSAMPQTHDASQIRQLRNRLKNAIRDVVDRVYLHPAGPYATVESRQAVENAIPVDDGRDPGSLFLPLHEVSKKDRRFTVRFRDESIRTVKPDFNDPTKFSWIGGADHDPITRRQVEEMASRWGFDPTKPEEFDRAFVKLREMSRQNDAEEKRAEFHHLSSRAKPV